MTTVDVTTPAPTVADTEAAPVNRPGRWWLDDRLVAIVVWLVGVGVAFEVVRVAKADPVSVRGAMMPVGIGLGVFTVLLRALWTARRAAIALIGAVVGAYGAWVALVTKAALYGTPMSFGGMVGDAHRITAQATKYATSWGSTDVFLPNTPSDYPPLYTWLTGRAAQLLGEPAWQLMQNTQVLWLSATVVAVFLLWRHLVPAPVAAIIAMLAFVGNDNPVKPYEVITLTVMVPWVLATVGNPPRARLHWLPAGIIGGLIFLTYQGYLVFMGLGILAVAWWAWHGAEDRRAYLLHLARVAASAFVVSSWYVVPYVWATLTRTSGSFGSDTFQSAILTNDPVPLHFLEPNPTGVLQLVGLVGLAVFFKRLWWARPIAALLAGTYAFIVLGALRFVLTGHTMFYQYAIAATVALPVAAGVLTVAEAVGRLAGHRLAPAAIRVVVLLAIATLASSSLVVWRAWMPTTVIRVNHPTVLATGGKPADLAHIEELPDLSRSRFAPTGSTNDGVPVALVEAAVVDRYGSSYVPMVLSQDERLFAYLPWYAYAAEGPTASPALDRWYDRNAELGRLAAITDPVQFADRAAATTFGPIDVFLLHNEPETGRLEWTSTTTFSADQFSSTAFDRVDLPNDFVLFVRHR
jgi:hypothetical protein